MKVQSYMYGFQQHHQLADHPDCRGLLDLAETKHYLADWTRETIGGGQVLTELAQKVMRSNVIIKFSLITHTSLPRRRA